MVSSRTSGQLVFRFGIVLLLASVLAPAEAQDEEIRVLKVTISLVRESSIPSRDAGVLAELPVREGDAVTKGQVVAVLENQQQELDLRAAELSLKAASMQADDRLAVDSAAAQLAESHASRRGKEVDLKIAEEQARSEVPIRVAVADTKLRQLELKRAENARNSFKGSISETELDRLRTALAKGELEKEQAENERKIQQLKPDAERAMLQQIDEQIRRYNALVNQEEKKLLLAAVSRDIRDNELALAKLKLEQRSMRVPFDGVIVSVDAHVGEWVEPGAAIARVIDLDHLQAEGFLPADRANVDLVGRPVQIRVRGISEAVAGKVTFVSPEVDPVQNQVRFKAEFENSERILRPGMIGELVIGQRF